MSFFGSRKVPAAAQNNADATSRSQVRQRRTAFYELARVIL